MRRSLAAALAAAALAAAAWLLLDGAPDPARGPEAEEGTRPANAVGPPAAGPKAVRQPVDAPGADAPSIEIRVTDAYTGAPVAGMRIALDVVPPRRPPEMRDVRDVPDEGALQRRAETTTDAEGVARLEDVPGRQRVG